MKIEIYPDVSNQWRWRARAKNKKITAASGESFASKTNATRAAKAFAKALHHEYTLRPDIIFVVDGKVPQKKPDKKLLDFSSKV